jgi:hypothetical protein
VTDTLTPPEGDAPEDDLEMGMDPWETNWIRFSVLLVVALLAAVTVAGFAAGFQLPGDEGQVDPRSLTESPPWDAPGVYEIGEGQFEAYIIGQTWSFAPAEIVLPVGAEVDMYITSPDLQHGFAPIRSGYRCPLPLIGEHVELIVHACRLPQGLPQGYGLLGVPQQRRPVPPSVG